MKKEQPDDNGGEIFSIRNHCSNNRVDKSTLTCNILQQIKACLQILFQVIGSLELGLEKNKAVSNGCPGGNQGHGGAGHGGPASYAWAAVISSPVAVGDTSDVLVVVPQSGHDLCKPSSIFKTTVDTTYQFYEQSNIILLIRKTIQLSLFTNMNRKRVVQKFA